MILKESETREEQVLAVARAMMAAARTAPKGRGVDNLEIATVNAYRQKMMVEKMREIGNLQKRDSFIRDAGNVENSQAVVLIGVRYSTRGLNCALCGFPTCGEKRREAPKTPCSFDTVDMGIALGAAVSIAADNRVDNRIMYSIGMAAQELGLMENCDCVMGVPLSVSPKSIYFDRPTHK